MKTTKVTVTPPITPSPTQPSKPPTTTRIHNASEFLRKTQSLQHKIYDVWFNFSKRVVEFFRKRNLVPIGATLGMLFTESDTLVRAAWHSKVKYNMDPKSYGLNTIQDKHRGTTPVIVLHGAAGSWNYLGDMAMQMKGAGVPVYVIDLGFGGPSEEMRDKLLQKINEVKGEYRQKFGQDTQVDLIAHSMGGNIAFDAAFSKETSKIDKDGNLIITETPKANPDVRRVMTLALPSTAEEKAKMQSIGKGNDLYNINAEYDELMAHKVCGLDDQHVEVVNAAHIGIVYSADAQQKVCEFIKAGGTK